MRLTTWLEIGFTTALLLVNLVLAVSLYGRTTLALFADVANMDGLSRAAMTGALFDGGKDQSRVQ